MVAEPEHRCWQHLHVSQAMYGPSVEYHVSEFGPTPPLSRLEGSANSRAKLCPQRPPTLASGVLFSPAEESCACKVAN